MERRHYDNINVFCSFSIVKGRVSATKEIAGGKLVFLILRGYIAYFPATKILKKLYIT